MPGTYATVLFAMIASSYLAVHVATLTRIPVPQFDDTFFASLADSYWRTGDLRSSISPLWIDKPVYLYGPIYFLMVRFVFEHFGFGLFQSRIVPLLFGLAILPVVFATLRRSNVPRTLALCACILLALDPTFNYSLHSGRMDNVALFFVLLSFLLLRPSGDAKGRHGLYLCAASGLFSALAVLTTPRSGYLVLLIGAVLAVRLVVTRGRSELLQLALWSLPQACLYSLWILLAFGGIPQLLTYYAGFAPTYVGGRFAVRMVHYPLLLVLLAMTAMRFVRDPRCLFDELVWFTLVGVVAFYVLGINPPNFGTVYAIFTIPLAYMCIARVMSGDGRGEPRFGAHAATIGYVLLGLLFVVNAAGFLGQTGLTFLQWNARDPRPAEEAVGQYVPAGSRVVGFDQFYFAVRRNGSDFQYIERGGTLPERLAYHEKVYDFDFLIVGESGDTELANAYGREMRLIKVGDVGRLGDESWGARLVTEVGRVLHLQGALRATYGATIFSRVRERGKESAPTASHGGATDERGRVE